MSRKPNGAQVPTPMIDPSMLPEDGSPIVYEQTFARRMGTQGQNATQSEEDFENSEWLIERQEPNGWAAIDKVRGRPYKPFLREMHGEGKFRVTPLVGNKPIEALQKIELVGNPVSPIRPEVVPAASADKPAAPDGDLPVWMRLMLQQQAEERALERERQARAEERREAWERAQAEKEFLRQERQERLDREKREQEAEDRRENARQRNELLLAGLGLVKEFAATKAAAPANGDDPTKAILLQHLLDKGKNNTPQSSMKETLDLLLVLDTMAQRRAESMPGPEKDDEDEGLGSTMMKMLPALITSAAGAGGGGGAPAQDPRAMATQLVTQAFQDPKLIAQIASQNPTQTARVFRQALKDNPELEKAVISVLEEEGS